jgi:predicted amidohydrolase YtcJ
MFLRALPILALMCAATAPAQQADLILHNGKVVTVDPQFRIAQAIAVAGGRIAAVGNNAEVLKLAGPQTQKVDLRGKTVLPGLIDSHVHSIAASMYEFDHTVPEMETIADVLKYFESRAKAVPEGKWIRLSQVFITRLRDQRFPTRQELDRVAPKHPAVFATGPDASLNSLALKLSGIDKDFKVTDGAPCRVERDENGEPNGILRSCGRFIKAESSGRQATQEDRRNRLKALFKDYNAVGLTSVADRDTDDREVELYRELRQRGELTCRVFMSLHIDAQAPIEQIEARMKKAAADPLHKYDNMLWLRGTKVYLDGGMLTGSAYMRRPWGVSRIYNIEDPDYRGMRFIEPSKLYRIARAAMMNELQPTAHAQGDGAVHTLIDAYGEVNNEFKVRDHRPCISHSSFMSLEAITKMKQIGVVADLQPPWLWLDGGTLTKQFGNERLEYFHPYKSLFEHGVVAGGGSDHMQKLGGFRSINPYNPFLGMWIVLTRQPKWTGEALHPEQRVTREQAIRLYTINNAFLTFEEKEKGSLEKGKLADLIVLERDILTVPVDQVKDIKVERTYLGGKQVHP